SGCYRELRSSFFPLYKLGGLISTRFQKIQDLQFHKGYLLLSNLQLVEDSAFYHQETEEEVTFALLFQELLLCQDQSIAV
ncbi:MAG: hypothetical protein KGD66_10315, partial [Candidatus Lokiarchaeota archaeon]|nr:hypothetical protein [Candidatus Lokiarchaeota archaeon]